MNKKIITFITAFTVAASAVGAMPVFADDTANGTSAVMDCPSIVPDVVLPNNTEEYEAWQKEHGLVSFFGEYVVFCGNVSVYHGGGLKLVQSGEGKLEEVDSYHFIWEYAEPKPVAGMAHYVAVYKAVSAGKAELNFYDCSTTYGEHIVYSENIVIDDDLNVSLRAESGFDGIVGDANGDGAVTVADAVTLYKWILCGTAPAAEPAALDMNGDGSVDSFDMVIMRREIVKPENAENPENTTDDELTGVFTITVIDKLTGKPLDEGRMVLGTNISIKRGDDWMRTGPVFEYELGKGNPVKHSCEQFTDGVKNGSVLYDVYVSAIYSNNKSKKYVIDEEMTEKDGENITVYVDVKPYNA